MVGMVRVVVRMVVNGVTRVVVLGLLGKNVEERTFVVMMRRGRGKRMSRETLVGVEGGIESRSHLVGREEQGE